MKLYFQAGKNHRLAIDTKVKVYSTNYWVLGGHKHYMKVTMRELNDLMQKIQSENYLPVNDIR